MQSIKIKIYCFGLLFILMSCGGNFPQAPVTKPDKPKPQGWDVGGGGNAHAAEFKDIGRTVVRRLKAKNVREVERVSIALFENTLEKLKINTTEGALKKGNEPVDARNFPTEQKIILSLVHWAVSMDFFEKRRLVIHEIIELMGLDDSGYHLTSKILTAIGIYRINFSAFQIYGEVARTLIEKMYWQSDERVTEKEFGGQITTYRIPFNSSRFKSNKPDIECTKLENVNFTRISDFYCWIRKYAYIEEDGVIHVSLVEEDGNHPLWRLFDSIKESRFDYGVIRGDRKNLLFTLEFLP